MTDSLREYARTGSADAFRSLLEAHIGAVHSQCLRQLRDPAAAEEVTQLVFITLAQKAGKIHPGVALDGWLFLTARYCCAGYKRAEARRRSAERKAALMRKETIESPQLGGDFQIRAEPILDDALAELGQRDRDAVLLRFFQGRSLREVGSKLGVSEDAAKQRISRAVEKLRVYFARRGVTAPSAAIAGFLGSAVKPATPEITQAALKAAVAHSASATIHAAGMLTRSIWTWPKIAAGLAIAGAMSAGVAVVVHGAEDKNPSSAPKIPVANVTPIFADALPPTDAPATQPSSQATPLDAFRKLCSALATDDEAGIRQCLCDDGKDAAAADLGYEFVEDVANIYRLEKAWKDRFGEKMKIPGFNLDAFPGGAYETLYRNTAETPGGPKVSIDGDVAMLRVAGPAELFTGTGPRRQIGDARWAGAMLVFNQVNGDWKLNTDRSFNFIIDLDRMDGNDADVMEVGNKIARGVNGILKTIAIQIENGTIASKGQAAAAVRSRVARLFRDARVNSSSFKALPVIGG